MKKILNTNLMVHLIDKMVKKGPLPSIVSPESFHLSFDDD